jgi:hypothetical protein
MCVSTARVYPPYKNIDLMQFSVQIINCVYGNIDTELEVQKPAYND